MLPENLDPLTVIVFSLIPIVVAVVKQQGWSKERNSIVALVVYVIAGAAWAFANQPAGGVTPTNVVDWIGTVAVIGTAAYALFWKNFETALVSATSIVKSPA